MVILAVLLQLAPVTPPTAPPAYTPPPLHGGPREMTCPVGGERFSIWQPTMYSTYGERPDGKPYGYLPFPFPVPECPSNRLIAFDSFSPDEVAKLAGIIDTVEYTRLTTTETTYYRAWWLAERLGRPPQDSLGLLLSAIWQVTPDAVSEPTANRDAEQRRRYQELFVAEVRRLPAATPAKDRFWLEARAANATRQLGRFGDAEALRKTAEASLSGLSEKKGWDTYLTKLKTVIARRDIGVEPLDMIPEQEADIACAFRPPSNAFDRAFCARPETAARVAEMRKSR
jgi:hypothetical protein